MTHAFHAFGSFSEVKVIERFTLRQLAYFVAVAEAGNIAAAAAKINISSPSISTAISQLEAEFGVQLFVRQHAKGLTLTSGGRGFLAEARNVLAAVEGLRAAAIEISTSLRGPLRVGCLSTFMQFVLPELRSRFEAAYPEINFAQTEADQSQLFDALRTAEIDIALTYDLEIPLHLSFEPLATLPAYVMLSAQHNLANRAQISPLELALEPMVLLDLPYSRDYFLSLFRAVGIQPNIAERTKDMGILRSMVANNFGFSLANIRPLGETAPDGKKLRYVPLAGDIRPMRMGLVTVRNIRKSRVVTAFEDHCRELINQTSIPGMTISAM